MITGKSTFYVKHKELILYCIVGVSSVVVNWLDYALMIRVMPMFFANAFSWGLTLLFGFLVNKIYVFESRCFQWRVVKREAITFFTTRGITGCLELVAQPQLYAMGMDRPLFGVEGLEAKVTVCVVLSIINYLSTKLLVFRRPGTKRMESV
ncbi:MAG: GtrA family protein [Clostridiaceae bacterium]|nr:GtrA family protein [Clostridiaceae bacterium]